MKWDTFNSDKVCTISYARLQGIDELMTHFIHSGITSEDERVQPIVIEESGRKKVRGMHARPHLLTPSHTFSHLLAPSHAFSHLHTPSLSFSQASARASCCSAA